MKINLTLPPQCVLSIVLIYFVDYFFKVLYQVKQNLIEDQIKFYFYDCRDNLFNFFYLAHCVQYQHRPLLYLAICTY